MPQGAYIFACDGDDTDALLRMLARAGVRAERLLPPFSWTDILHDAGSDALFITNEALERTDLAALARALETQPAWSDIPIVLLTRRGKLPPLPDVVAQLQNVTLMERPLHEDALGITLRVILRARNRQRAILAQLRRQESAEQKAKTLAGTLEQRVAERTAELSEALAERTAAVERHRYTIELSGLIPWSWDSPSGLVSIGERWHILTGAPIDESLSDTWRRYVHQDDLPDMAGSLGARIAAMERFDFQFRMRMRDGQFRHFHIRGAPSPENAEGAIRWYGTLEDIETKQIAEEKLRQLQSEMIHFSRVTAMGAMAATLAHELNQPLTAIANYLRGAKRLLAAMPGDGQMLDTAISEAERGAIRAGEVVRRLRELVARRKVVREVENLAVLAQQAARIALVDIAPLGISCAFDIDDDISVFGDRIQLQQVLINLMRNAIDALQGSSKRQMLVSATRAQAFCRVTVHDSGPGLTAAQLETLFEPFVTSKEQGIGIGLSISRTIVEANGGQLSAGASRLGGAAFHFTIPIPKT